MDPILENEASTSDTPSKHGKAKKPKKKDTQTVVGERRKFFVTKLSATEQDKPNTSTSTGAQYQSNAHTVHFGNRGVESQRPHVRSIFKEKPVETSRPSSAERENIPKEYETFHGTSTSPKSSIFDIFKIRRKSDSKKHQSIMQNVKAALGGLTKTAEAPESTSIEKVVQKDETKSSHKKYYHTVTGASSRNYSSITKMINIFKIKPHTEATPSNSDPGKKKNSKSSRRSSIGTTSPTYHKNSYSSLDPLQAKQLFKEVRGLPKYDPYLSIVQISLGGRDKTRLLLNFFKYHRCYEILPKSAKVIIFDTQFLVRKTFPTLISHGIRSAPLWDLNRKQLIGMITVTDFIRVLLQMDEDNICTDELERHTLHTWTRLLRPFRKPLCSVGPDQSLHEAINLLNKNRVHRLLLIDPNSGDVLYILSHKRILRFLFVYLNEFPEVTFFHKNLVDLKIGTYEDIVSVRESTTVREAFQLLLEKDISAVPILDDQGRLIDVYAKYEVLNLVSEKLYSNLSLTIAEVRTKKKDWEEKIQKCSTSITLYEALEVIVRTESHRLLLVDRENKLIGIVSLSDILVYLNRIIPSEKKVSSLQELFRPLQENKVTESSKESENEDVTLEVPNIISALNKNDTDLNTVNTNTVNNSDIMNEEKKSSDESKEIIQNDATDKRQTDVCKAEEIMAEDADCEKTQ